MSHAEAETPILSSTYSADWSDRRTMPPRWAGGPLAAVARQWLSSIYNTHNQKGKDKERLRLRGGAPAPCIGGQSEFVVQNRFFTTHFRRHLGRYSQIPPGDLSHEIRPLTRPSASDLPARRLCGSGEKYEPLAYLSRVAWFIETARARCGFSYLPVKHGARAEYE